MTRKDYQTLAACFALARRDNWDKPDVLRGIEDVRARVTLELELDNPRFNPRRFNDAIETLESAS